jgi:hypothetical protein
MSHQFELKAIRFASRTEAETGEVSASSYNKSGVLQKKGKAMARKCVAVFLGVFINCACCFGAEKPDKILESKIVKVDLFKNGLCIIERIVDLPDKGEWEVLDTVEPIHGTFWTESDVPVEAHCVKKEFFLEENTCNNKLFDRHRTVMYDILLGRKIRYHHQSRDETTVGVVESIDSSNLLLKTETGFALLKVDNAYMIETLDKAENLPVLRKVKIPVLNLSVRGVQAEGKCFPVKVKYIAHGLTWTPSYKVDIATGAKKLKLTQKAVIRNEVEGFENADTRVISGFPHVVFGTVRSPLKEDLSAFFNQVNSAGRDTPGYYTGTVATGINYRYSERTQFTTQETGSAADLHFLPLGKLSLGKDEAMTLSLGKGDAEYAEIALWEIPDFREEYGSYIPYERRRNKDKSMEDEVWNILRFTNPLGRSLTSAVVTCWRDGNFVGQDTLSFASPKEEVSVRTNLSASIRVKALEEERPVDKNRKISKIPSAQEKEETRYYEGSVYYKRDVEGTLRISSQRAEEATMEIRNDISGEFLDSDLHAEVIADENSLLNLNPGKVLIWKIVLKPHEKRTIKYRYCLWTR